MSCRTTLTFTAFDDQDGGTNSQEISLPLAQLFSIYDLILSKIKASLIKLLESHPYGYAIGVFFLDRCDFLLPHEPDYLAFPELAKRCRLESKVILDLGANRGHSARAFLKLLPGWQVVSFEANPLHGARLLEISSKHPDRFSFHICAVTDRAKGNVDIHTPLYGRLTLHSASALVEREAISAAESAFRSHAGRFSTVTHVTPTTSIDELKISASIIKLDIQGEELNALKGMVRTIEQCNPIMLIEMNLASKDLIEFMNQLDYLPYQFDPAMRRFDVGEGLYSVHARNQLFVHRSFEAFLI